jgi:hypothetical protein
MVNAGNPWNRQPDDSKTVFSLESALLTRSGAGGSFCSKEICGLLPGGDSVEGREDGEEKTRDSNNPQNNFLFPEHLLLPRFNLEHLVLFPRMEFISG